MDFQVTFIPEDNFLYMPEYTNALQRAGIEVLYAPYTISVEQHLKEYGDRYNLVFLFRPIVAKKNLKIIRKYCFNSKVLYHTIDLHFLRMSREAEIENNLNKRKEAEKMKKIELNIIKKTDASIVHSTKELEILTPLVKDARLYVLPLIMNKFNKNKKYHERNDIVFVGGYQHTPNVDAVIFFVKDVMPFLRKKIPGICFYVVGSNIPNKIQELAAEDVLITGYLKDLENFLLNKRVFVSPLRYGAGVKGKIGMAMSVGIPVVATALSIEGMQLTESKNILVANEPEEFAETIYKIYQNEELWNLISENGSNFVEKEFGDEAVWKKLAKVLSELGFTISRGNYSLSLYR